ncbi:MAG: XRE family transcriptional regulator [Hyphomicrobiales bacterium]|nr:MAG: XRE family transcriptional regulator [Hyphomicrobiales bacterium]
MPRPVRSSSSTFGRRLRSLREQAGLSQEKLGVAIGLDEGPATVRIGRYENGIHEPSSAVVELLARALGVLPPYFSCEDDDLAEVIRGWSQLTEAERHRARKIVKRAVNRREKADK